MAIENREAVLSQLSERLGRKRPETVEKPDWTISPQRSVFEGLTQDELVSKLIEQCEAIHTEVKLATRAQLIEAVNSYLKEWGAKTVIYANDKRFNDYGLSEFLINESTLDCRMWESENKEENIEFAKKADVGMTFSDITLAESGTAVLFNDGIKGRPVSLLPESYIAIIPKSTIVPRLTQAAEAIHQQSMRGEKLPSCVNFISGPSNSADIEMNLVVGVHGPVRAGYIIVDDKENL
ncbi:L-lactate dehydrogenase complex protein LldG [Scopulibacillus daqui]|uniref:Lactate utilization protein C n=1 Tax=Scopulibacillus daqui TaxID=1469162 RepID=A0ABS2Q3T1_9BACL|nr:lactate utilization protein C [Scopulibacillus daqui]MBM7646955.1 L-lactate dehydrogenase complex protein LldG [Scopulibacillus daqui]